MHVVSVCLHYGNIIWLPWQRPLSNRKIRSRFIIYTQSALIRCEDYENRSSRSGDIRLNTSGFGGVYQTFTNELCQLWSCWTEFHEIFTRYRGIICAINMHIEVAISHFVSECHSDESGEFAIFYKIGCHGNVPWDIGKRGSDLSSAPKTLSFDEKIAKKSVQRILR